MLVGDPHCTPEDTSDRDIAILKDYLAFQYAAVKREKPDLVVLMGDNARGKNPEELKKTLLRITKPYADSGTPFSFILGNHDLECAVSSLEAQYEIYAGLPCCVLPENYTEFGDYHITVKASGSEEPILNLFHIYSGSRAQEKYYSYYDFVKKAQIKWMEETQKTLNAGGKTVPSVVFQHIPVPEEFSLLKRTSFFSMLTNGVTGQNEESGKFFRLKKEIPGYLGEAPCAPAYNSGEFDALKNTPGVFAMFFGHDHMNDFVGTHDGMILGQVKLSSFNAYGDGLMQGVRILEFDEDTPFRLNTRMLRYRDIFSDQCRSIQGSEKRLRDRTSVKLETGLKTLGILTAAALPLFLLKKILK